MLFCHYLLFFFSFFPAFIQFWPYSYSYSILSSPLIFPGSLFYFITWNPPEKHIITYYIRIGILTHKFIWKQRKRDSDIKKAEKKEDTKKEKRLTNINGRYLPVVLFSKVEICYSVIWNQTCKTPQSYIKPVKRASSFQRPFYQLAWKE